MVSVNTYGQPSSVIILYRRLSSSKTVVIIALSLPTVFSFSRALIVAAVMVNIFVTIFHTISRYILNESLETACAATGERGWVTLGPNLGCSPWISGSVHLIPHVFYYAKTIQQITRVQNKNVTFSVVHTDISHAMKLSSVWPINFQYHSEAAAAGYRRVGNVEIGCISQLCISSNI